MFREKTTFVIGAGAGVDIDMPTGADLIKEMEERLTVRVVERRYQSLGSHRIFEALRRVVASDNKDLNTLVAAAGSIVAGVHHMGSIDSYIHAHSHDENIKLVGKIAITDTILHYERRCSVFIDFTRHPQIFRDNTKVRQSWLDNFMNLLMHRVVVRQNLEDVFSNLAIINFNYDRCLEQYLYFSLQKSLGLPEESAARLMSKLLIHHPYGSVAKLPWEERQTGLHLGGDPHSEESVNLEALSRNIRTFNEEVATSPQLDAVKEFLAHSSRIVFLGFHFHEQNMLLIQPKARQAKIDNCRVYASTYGRSLPEKHRLRTQIENLFIGITNVVHIQAEIALCKELLNSYGTTLVS